MSTAPNMDNRKVWICAHGRMDIENARTFHARFLKHPECSFTSCDDEGCVENVHTTLTSYSLKKQMHCTLESRIRLFEAMEYDAAIPLSTIIKQSFTKSRLAQLLPHLHVPVCAHINLKDPDIAKHFSPSVIWNEDGKVPLNAVSPPRPPIPAAGAPVREVQKQRRGHAVCVHGAGVCARGVPYAEAVC
jgi:hypothetical protein